MSLLWWLQPGWENTTCARCGAKIYPEGDPDWGLCYSCFTDKLRQKEHEKEHYADMERDYSAAMEAEYVNNEQEEKQ